MLRTSKGNVCAQEDLSKIYIRSEQDSGSEVFNLQGIFLQPQFNFNCHRRNYINFLYLFVFILPSVVYIYFSSFLHLKFGSCLYIRRFSTSSTVLSVEHIVILSLAGEQWSWWTNVAIILKRMGNLCHPHFVLFLLDGLYFLPFLLIALASECFIESLAYILHKSVTYGFALLTIELNYNNLMSVIIVPEKQPINRQD